MINFQKDLFQLVEEASMRFNIPELGFDPMYCTERIIHAMEEHSETQGDGLCAFVCYINDLTEEHKEQIKRTIQCSFFTYGVVPGTQILDSHELALAGVSLEILEQHQTLIACFLAGERQIGREMAADPLWLKDKEHLNFITGMCYLLIRSFDTAVMFQQTVAGIKDISVELNASAGIKAATLPQKKEMQEKLIRVSTLADISKSFLNTDELYKNLSTANSVNNQLKSKISILEKDLAAKDAAQRLAVSANEQRIEYLEKQIEEKNKQLSSLGRIEELERRLDEASTKAQMMQAMLRQEREKAQNHIVAEPPKEEELAAIDLDSMRVVMIGGNPNFLNKLKLRFPAWTILTDELIRVRPSKVDLVLYNYLHCSHSLYNCGKQLAAQTSAIEIYVENTNIEKFEDEVRHKINEALMA